MLWPESTDVTFSVVCRRELMPNELIEKVRAERRLELLNAGRWVRVGAMEVRFAD